MHLKMRLFNFCMHRNSHYIALFTVERGVKFRNGTFLRATAAGLFAMNHGTSADKFVVDRGCRDWKSPTKSSANVNSKEFCLCMRV